MMDKIVYEAVLENVKNRERFRLNNEDKNISKVQWMKQFCTIHLNIGRDTGKTRHIIENAKTGDLIVCGEGTKKFIQHSTKEKLDFYVPHITKAIQGKILGEVKIIFVDEPKQTLKPFIDDYEFYATFMVNFNEPIFIMLGE